MVGRPLLIWLQEAPAFVLTCMPPVDVVAYMVLGSTGTISMPVTEVTTRPALEAVHDCPLSVLLKIPPSVPTNRLFSFVGSTAIARTFRFVSPALIGTHVSAAKPAREALSARTVKRIAGMICRE